MKRETRIELIIGAILGISGIAFDVLFARLFKTNAFVGAAGVFVVVAALFAGSVSACLAGGICMAGALLVPLTAGAGFMAGVPGAVGVLVATCMAVAARRWMFFGRRPASASAALCAVFAVMLHALVQFLFGIGNINATLADIHGTLMPVMAFAALVAALVPFVIRLRQSCRENLIAGVCALMMAAIVGAVYLVQDRAASRSAADTAEAIQSDAVVAVDYPIEPEMLRFAQLLIDESPSIAAMTARDLASDIRRGGYDMLLVVGADGKVKATTDPAYRDFDFSSDKTTAEFLCINKGRRYFAQPFRRPILVGAGMSGSWLKYVGLAIPGGGFVVLGESFDDVYKRDYLFQAAMQDWHVGENGSMLLVEPKDRYVVSGFKKEYTGKTMAEVGLEGLVFPKDGGFARGRVLGEESFVKRIKLDFVPLEVYIVMPAADITAARDLSVFVTAVVLLLVFATGATLFAKILRQQHDLDLMYAKDAERRHKDMELAKNIQTSALPSVFVPFPNSTEVDLYAVMRAAKEVGGDFFDFYPLGPRRLFMVVADVSGKGVPAALFMMKAKAVIKAAALSCQDLGSVMTEANDALCLNNSAEMFVTAWIGAFDLDTGMLEYVSAGHNPPFVRRAGGKVERLDSPRALVLAGMEGIRYRISCATLNPGDRLFLYTDGVTEAQSAAGAFFGEKRLVSTLAENSDSAKALCAHVIGTIDAFAADAPQADDITVFAMGWRGRDRVQTRAFPATMEGLGNAAQFLQSTLDASECPEQMKSRLLIALDEIASNIVRYSGASDFLLKVEREENPAMTRLVFVDSGVAYNPLEKEDPDVTLAMEDRKVGGLGIHMVKKMMSSMEYARVDGRNVLTLCRNWS